MIEASQTGIWLDSLRRLNGRGVVLFVCILDWQLVFRIDGDIHSEVFAYCGDSRWAIGSFEGFKVTGALHAIGSVPY